MRSGGSFRGGVPRCDLDVCGMKVASESGWSQGVEILVQAC